MSRDGESGDGIESSPAPVVSPDLDERPDPPEHDVRDQVARAALLPMTWAVEQVIRHQLRQLDPALVRDKLRQLRKLKALEEANESSVPVSLTAKLIDERLDGWDGLGQPFVHYSETTKCLAILGEDGRTVPIADRARTLSPMTHRHVWRSTAGWKVQFIREKVTDAQTPDSASLFHLALGGDRRALGALGIPLLSVYDVPAAYVSEEWRVHDGVVRGVLPFRWRDAKDDAIDPSEFFTQLARGGRLPIAEEHIPLLLMALASPLLRYVAPGLLGVYWLVGEPGAGKDFLADLAVAVWQEVAGPARRVSGELSVTDDLEAKRSAHATARAVYLRAREAGKRRGMLELLIRLAGTSALASRGMRRDEVVIPNAYTILADSAEEVPEGREISRRTVVIPVRRMDEQVSKGDVIRELQAAAGPLLRGLLRHIEQEPREWYLNQRDLGARPLLQVGLARRFGAKLPEVEGRDLNDVFDAMLEYVSSASEEGQAQMRKARPRDGWEASQLPNYRVAHFIDVMSQRAGYRDLFKDAKTAAALASRIRRELPEYTRVDQGTDPYLRVTVGTEAYAFKLVKQRRNFVLMTEQDYRQRTSPSGP